MHAGDKLNFEKNFWIIMIFVSSIQTTFLLTFFRIALKQRYLHTEVAEDLHTFTYIYIHTEKILYVNFDSLNIFHIT